MEGEKTILTKATSKSKSLRTTVPAGIARQFKLKQGDTLEWEIKPKKDTLVIVIRPIMSVKKGNGI